MNKVVEVTRNHTMSLQTAQLKAGEVAARMQESLGIRWQWTNGKIVFDCPSGVGKGSSGSLEVTDKTIRVTINLFGLVSLMHVKVEAEVKEELSAAGIPA